VRNGLWIVAAIAVGCNSGGSAESAAGTTTTATAATATTEPLTSGSGSVDTSNSVGSGAVGSTTDAATSDETSADDSTGTDAMPCNGAAALCGRTYDAVVFPGTHNSVAATESGFSVLNANQVRPVLAQLEDGIRVLLLDVTYDNGETVLCHGRCGLGSRSHVEVMTELHQFLVEHPREVVTIIYQDSVDPSDVEADYVEVDLVGLTYTHRGGAWPTLGEMIDADTRLVVTAESQGPPPAWYHHVWDVAWDTPYTFTSVEDFSCVLNRGETGHALMLMNHWLSNGVGLPDAAAAETSNAAETLMDRVGECHREAGRLPTFIAVDFYETGDLFAVVDALNGVQ